MPGEGGNLHRDISAGNILITDEAGMLIDWDFSKHKDVQRRRIPVRTGTWQFMSAHLLLKEPGTVEHERADDLESFFHVLCWITLIYGPHDLALGGVNGMLATVYDCWWDRDNGKSKGGTGKYTMFGTKQMAREAQLKDGPLKDLIVALEKALAVCYSEGPSQTQWKMFEALKANPGFEEAKATLFDAAIVQPDKLTDEPKKRAITNTPRERILDTLHTILPSSHVSQSNDNKRKTVQEQPSGSGTGTGKNPKKRRG
ncbi:hypothetical protein MPER_08761 [Moniliophthora perniciosa FA553]|nr:hypothetical protein MPER_08761 [Moniliophthora perniciosa FA553]